MAWENGRYIRKRWDGETCVSEYVGSGDYGRLMHGFDVLEREQRKVELAAFRAMARADKALAKAVDDIGKMAGNMAAAKLIVEGYHTHKRQWRKDTMAETVTVQMSDLDKAGMAQQGFSALIERIDRGNPSPKDRAALAECFKAAPDLAAQLGDAARIVATGMIEKLYSQQSSRLAAAVYLENMQADLGYAEAEPTERSLINHIAVCWFRLQYVEYNYSAAAMGGGDQRTSLHWERRLTSAQGRYVRAVESLARVRRLLRPDKSPVLAMLLNQQFHGK